MQRKQSLFKTTTLATALGLWTSFTLAGSVWVWLFLLGPNSITRLDLIRSNNIMVLLIVALNVYVCGGGLWGLGIARLMNRDVKAIVKSCAFSWTATVVAFSTMLGLSLGSIFKIAELFPNCCHSTHYYFLSIFVPVIGIVTAINGYVVTSKLGFAELKKSAGLYAGIAAALGFLTVGLILLYGLGWEVGRPVPGKYQMLKLMQFCNIGAALAGGMALGWSLDKSRIRVDG